ncbi:MAG: preprotein translocase subunit YajC [Dehalococcoidia bacterium]|nr:preprotein translocase subunit YajC [Dehalococcoidia bacterium]
MDNNTLIMLGFLALMFVVFYFLIIRPQRKRQQDHQAVLSALKPGDQIVTIGGIYGEIDSMTDENLVIKVETGTLRIARQAVAYKQGEPSK